MGVLTDDMARLRGEVNLLRDERRTLAKNIKENTQNRKDTTMEMREQFRDAHFAMAESSKRDRIAWFSGLKSNIAAMKEGFYSDFAVVREAIAEMAASTQRANSRFVATMKSDVAQMKEGFRLTHAAMADKSQTDRMAFLSALKANVSKMQEDFSKNRQDTARTGRLARAAALSALRTDVSNLMTSARSDLDEDRRLFSEMVRNARANRVEFSDGLKKSVDDLRKKFLEDITGAHVAWFAFPQEPVHIAAKGNRQGPAEAELKKVEAERLATEKAHHRVGVIEDFQSPEEPEPKPVMVVEEQKAETTVHQGVEEMPETRSKEERRASKRDRNR